MKPTIKIPVKIVTPKIAPNKQNSVFYAGQNIAEVKVLNRTYVLTTAGEYSFSLKEGEGQVSFQSGDLAQAWTKGKLPGRRPPRTFTDAQIKKLNDNDLVSNWGWFGMNIWVQDEKGDEVLLPDPTNVWSDYDEALKSFIELVEKDLYS